MKRRPTELQTETAPNASQKNRVIPRDSKGRNITHSPRGGYAYWYGETDKPQSRAEERVN
jgi:hypothetical protein